MMTTSIKRRVFTFLPATTLALILGVTGSCLAEPTLPRSGAFGPATTARSTAPEALARTPKALAGTRKSNSLSESSTVAHPRNNIPL